MNEKRLILTLTAAFAASLAIAISIGNSTSDPDAFRLEVAKYFLQLAIIIVLGGVIAALFKLQEQRRERADFLTQLYESYILRLGEIYRRVKHVRRTLRAAGLSSVTQPGLCEMTDRQFAIYRDQMAELDESQLKLEGIMIESIHLPVLASVPTIQNSLHLMEDYLRCIHAEFEMVAATESHSFAALKRLDEFTGNTDNANVSFDDELTYHEENGTNKNYRFLDSFWKPYEEVVSELSKMRPGST